MNEKLQTKVDDLKSKNFAVYSLIIGDKKFIYRIPTPTELDVARNTGQEAEETAEGSGEKTFFVALMTNSLVGVLDRGVEYLEDYDAEKVWELYQNTGTPTTLIETMMITGGYVPSSEPERL